MYKIFGKNGCGYCRLAKELLTSEGEDFEYLSLGEDYTKEYLVELVGGSRLTYPRIFKDGELIGGYDELLETLI